MKRRHVQSRIANEPVHPLTILLQKYDQRSSTTQAQMSRDCWLDETYISRLLRGQRTHPSRAALILLADQYYPRMANGQPIAQDRRVGRSVYLVRCRGMQGAANREPLQRKRRPAL
jgi:hypothetical protein